MASGTDEQVGLMGFLSSGFTAGPGDLEELQIMERGVGEVGGIAKGCEACGKPTLGAMKVLGEYRPICQHCYDSNNQESLEIAVRDRMIKQGGKMVVKSVDGGTITYEYTEPDPNDVEIDIDGWWVVWDLSKGGPLPQAVFKWNHQAREFIHLLGPQNDHLEMKQVTRK